MHSRVSHFAKIDGARTFDLLQVIKTEVHGTAATAILKISMALEYLTCCSTQNGSARDSCHSHFEQIDGARILDLLQVIETEVHGTAATAILKKSMALEHLTCSKSSKRKCTGQPPQQFRKYR